MFTVQFPQPLKEAILHEAQVGLLKVLPCDCRSRVGAGRVRGPPSGPCTNRTPATQSAWLPFAPLHFSLDLARVLLAGAAWLTGNLECDACRGLAEVQHVLALLVDILVSRTVRIPAGCSDAMA